MTQATFCVRWGPSSFSTKRERIPQFSANVYCGQTAGWIKTALGLKVGLGQGHIVLDGEPSTSHPLHKKGGQSPPIIGLFLLWPNGWMQQDTTWYGGRPAPGSPSPKSGAAPNFEPMSIVAAHVYCGQTARWIKMLLGTEVGLSPGDNALDGVPAPHQPRRGTALNFRPMSLGPNVCMYQDTT